MRKRGLVPVLEAHGTGTALGDPIEVSIPARVVSPSAPSPLQVGAAARALCKPAGANTALSSAASTVQCTSLKSNMGHLEPSAAAAGLAALVLVGLGLMSVATNAQLRRSVVSDE